MKQPAFTVLPQLPFMASFLLILVLCLYNSVNAQWNYSNTIKPGSSLFPTINPSSWLSPSGRFAFGFHLQRNGFIVAIWLVGKPNIITWTAFRDDPPVLSKATLEFTMDGKLILRSDHDKIITTNLEKSASYALMLDSGNFVL